MRLVGETPEECLRDLLLRFPFLPIDAGQGADRVIGCFARAFVKQNPQPLMLDSLDALDAVGASSSDSDDEVAALSAEAPPPAVTDRAARDAVYTLTYSIIMLNTDLHNPAIQPKISSSEYAASCRRCEPLRAVADETLVAIYESIKRHPLQIYHGQPGVATAVRASEHADDSETAASYSVYSAMRRPTAPEVAAHAPPAREGGSAGAPSCAEVQIDWAVAYYNLLDATRYVRSASWLYLSNRATRTVVLLRTAASARGLLSLAVVAMAVLLLRARA